MGKIETYIFRRLAFAQEGPVSVVTSDGTAVGSHAEQGCCSWYLSTGALPFDGFSLVAILFRYTRAWVHVIRAFLLLASLPECGVSRCPKLGPLALAAGW